MTKGIGNDYFLWVETATPDTYAMPKGQQTFQRSGTPDKVDTTSKDSGGYKTSRFTFKDWNGKVDILPDLPDAAGYTRLETLVLAYPQVPFKIQIRKGGTAGTTGDVVFQALVTGAMTQQDASFNTPLKSSFEFMLSTAPTVDAMAV
ncbi:hypothetical protein U1839_06085 [Sphingomonas sp. RT2P30]|uniref:hypothetical protein n=1 Tax=Parasphingomonas halimpatiens TaxID=3096162 RepID=UPI002FC5D887